MIKVSPDLKFSYDFVKGSQVKRNEYVHSLNSKIFTPLENKINNGGATFDDYKKIFYSVIPEKKKVKFSSLSQKNSRLEGAADYIYSDRGHIIGQSMEIPLKKGKFDTGTLITAVHEGTHILDVFANPKYTARRAKLYINGKYGKSSNEWFDGSLSKLENVHSESEKKACIDNVREKTSVFLSGKSYSDKIDYLQDARYELEQERNAYSEQLKYAKILNGKGKEVDPSDLKDGDKSFLLTEKINLLKQMCFDVISNVRSKQALKCK